MQSWHTTYLGLKDLPRELSTFELQAFFTFSRSERAVIDARYRAGERAKVGADLKWRCKVGPSSSLPGRAQ